ncbi:hypothetical protein OGH69_10375 [Flavobacterium sp. MFBS3-15]|uniref:hypothetical protein n=1 Tax=Flavobacterium sp. MFBS3-15 TaxID=2989816 RepID=UPI002236679B|nr:hypothetical protein [Flavobacterium sp. MFBS3-15]MCW4469371.1 hypothetical protein [Flavobacterium sp. MFBS3-15]
MEPNRLEEQFRDKLEQRTIQPSKMAWDRLDAMLSVNEEKEVQKAVPIKKPNRGWMYMVASFVLFATIGTFFLTRESYNGSTPEGTGRSVVNTEKPVETEGHNDTVQPSGTGATDNISVPIKQEAMAAQTPGASQKIVPVKAQSVSQAVKEYDVVPQQDSQSVAVVPENLKPEAQKEFEAEKLLAANHPAPKKKSTVKVDAGSLLSSVEGELDESFRDKALQGAIKNFNAVKTAVVNRNYQ